MGGLYSRMSFEDQGDHSHCTGRRRLAACLAVAAYLAVGIVAAAAVVRVHRTKSCRVVRAVAGRGGRTKRLVVVVLVLRRVRLMVDPCLLEWQRDHRVNLLV